MSLNLFSFLSSVVPGGPSIGKVKYYHDDSIFNRNVAITGDKVVGGNSLSLGQSTFLNSVFILKNPFFSGSVPILFVDGPIIGNKTLTINGYSLFNGVVTINGFTTINNKLILSGVGDVASYMTTTRTIAVSKKSFDIPHPTKEDYRLRYVCLEGPSAEVYYRGKLKNSNIIEVPDYWRSLIDVETIGVSLTPIGVYQELFVENVDDFKITVKNNTGESIHCYYTITAERSDTPKNIPEYKGLTPNDYPGDNESYTVNGG